MSKIVNQIIEVNRNNTSINWNGQSLPLLPREKLFSQASGLDHKLEK